MPTYTATANLQVQAILDRRDVGVAANLTVQAALVSAPKSIQLPYLGVGPAGQTDNIATKKFADNYFSQNGLVNQSFVQSESDFSSINLLLQSDAASNLNALNNNGNRVYPRLDDLSSFASQYADSSVLGKPTGVANANSFGSVATTRPVDAQGTVTIVHPNISTDNKAVYYNCVSQGIVYLTNSQTVNGNSITEYRAATITIEDPGFSYYPMSFVYIQGKSSGSAPSRNTGTQSMGLITVARAPANNEELPSLILSQGTCISSPYRNWHMAVPYINKWTQNPPVRTQPNTTAFRGPMTINLYLGNYSGTYTFYGSGLVWYIILMPTNTPA